MATGLCDRCGRPTSYGASFCDRCLAGVTTTDTPIAMSGTVHTTLPAYAWMCPVCRAVYAPFVASCLRCGTETPAPKTTTYTGQICPICLRAQSDDPQPRSRCEDFHWPKTRLA